MAEDEREHSEGSRARSVNIGVPEKIRAAHWGGKTVAISERISPSMHLARFCRVLTLAVLRTMVMRYFAVTPLRLRLYYSENRCAYFSVIVLPG